MMKNKEVAIKISNTCYSVISLSKKLIELRDKLGDSEIISIFKKTFKEQCIHYQVDEKHIRKIMKIDKIKKVSNIKTIAKYEDR